VFLVLALAATACDSPLSAVRRVVRVEIAPEDLHLPLNGFHQLSAEAMDERGVRLTGAVEIRWASSDTSVVYVSPSGLVAARAAGSARVTAAVGEVQGSALVSVGAPLPAECSSILALGVGEVHTVAAGEGGLLCFEAQGSEAEYTMIPFYGSATAGAAVAIDVSVRSEAQPSGIHSDQPSVARGRSAIAGNGRAPKPDAGWEQRLRQREARELAPLLSAAAGGAPEPNRSTAAPLPSVGSRLTLNVNAESACTNPSWRSGTVVAVTERAVVVADSLNPAGGFDVEDYRQFGRLFDTLVYPVVTHNFGTPTDIDGNGRVLLFFTSAVNEMGRGAGGVIRGFFFSRDLFPRRSVGGPSTCEASNEAEILYLMVPDAARSAGNSQFDKDNVQRGTVASLAHELQHLVNASQRVLGRVAGFEESWLNEGLSHIAEELVGNRVAGIGRAENVDYPRLRATPENWDGFARYHRANFNRLGEHLGNPSATPLFQEVSTAGRGATWQFLRYAADRKGGEESTIWRALANAPVSGLRNLERALGDDPMIWLRDWAIAVYTDDAIPHVVSTWRQPAWNYRSVFAGIRADNRYPLLTERLPGNDTTSVTIVAGGAAYLTFGVPPAGRTEVRTSWDGGLTPPHRLFVSVVRTR
jgi:hypothetical protein